MQTISATSRWDLARYFPGAPERLLQRPEPLFRS